MLGCCLSQAYACAVVIDCCEFNRNEPLPQRVRTAGHINMLSGLCMHKRRLEQAACDLSACPHSWHHVSMVPGLYLREC